MKILIAYDGSNCSEAALDDLQRAGLPDEAEALIVSVAEAWLPPPPKNETLSEYAKDLQTHQQPFKAYQTGAKAVTEAETLALHAQKRLLHNFPKWKIEAEATFGSPAWEILSRAADYKPDLIVAGSHGRSTINRLLLGSISQKILTEASCSVRVARGKVEVDPVPVRIVIGFDGSQGSIAAIEAVASRNWREQSEVKLIAATDPVTPSAIGRFIPPISHLVDEVNESEREWIEKIAAPYLELLNKARLQAKLHMHAGSPKQILIEEAEMWHADAIFVGANSYGSRFERFLLGSVSSAVAARAHCSVEVVRKLKNDQKNN
ncbi:MAG: Universal stress protein UspA-like nucleotide-binding protein [Acidobacteria bacterium]|jgi:nucleotide-binding universal stress UspA family protein|nr:Universal stress protein UspA-like nucleotide-binding protein [Acidobacteriota bacterium]